LTFLPNEAMIVMQGDAQMAETETNQMIENLILNAEDGETFGGLRQREANRYQLIAWNNRRGVRIEVENSQTRTYRAVVVC
jgi:hypothetical protein